MKLKKLILGLALFAFVITPMSCFGQQVSDSVIRGLIAKYKAQNYLGCIQESEKITKTNPSNIYAYYYRGLAYVQLGQKEKALDAFAQVESLNSNAVLVEYAKKGTACLNSPEECAKYGQANDELDMFIKSNKFYDKSVQSEVNKKKLDRIKENINEELGPKKSEMPSNDEIANAVKTLAKLGINPLAGMSTSYQNPEMMQMNMLLGDNSQQYGGMNNNMLPMLLMSQNQNGAQKMSPELIQTMMMSQMPMY